MNVKLVRQLIVVVIISFYINTALAQVDDLHGNEALRVYYSDLYLELSSYDLNDVPFEKVEVQVGLNDSLLTIARRHSIPRLDALHLAAALYEANSHAFANSEASKLTVGAMVRLPTITDIFIAQDRYERLKVVGENIDFTSEENQMAKALRWPFEKSLVMIGPSAKDELPRNTEVTLTSYRPDAAASRQTSGDFLSRALTTTSEARPGPRIGAGDGTTGEATYSKWLSELDDESTNNIQRETVSAAVSEQASGGSGTKGRVDTAPVTLDAKPKLVDSELLADAESPTVSAPDTTAKPAVVAIPVAKQDQALEPADAVEDVETVSDTIMPEPVMAAMLPTREARVVSEVNVNNTDVISPWSKEPTPVLAEVKPRNADPAETSRDANMVIKPNAMMDGNAPADYRLENITATPAVAEKSAPGKAALVEPALTETKAVRILSDKKAPATISSSDVRDVYLGAPRNKAVSLTAAPTDPLSYIVEWSFDEVATVGAVLGRLADYVGYELVSTDTTVLRAYERRLPAIQRQVSGVPAEEGFAILAGRGLETVFDHVSRSVKHIPVTAGQTKQIEKIARGASDKNSEAHEKFVQASGIATMLNQFPTDMLSAAGRHADRCDSTAESQMPDAERLYRAVVRQLSSKTPEPVARNLVGWYESPVGQKVRALESREIDDATLQKFTANRDRIDRIQRIYNNSVTGKAISNFAIALDYAGWTLSGCKEKAERSGVVKQMHNEMILGQDIKKKTSKLEALLRDDMIRSMSLQFSSLSEQELTEYANITEQHAGVYSELRQSIIDAIESEAGQLITSSMH